MKIIGSNFDFEAVSARIKFLTKREGAFISFKIIFNNSIIFTNQIKIETFLSIYAKLTKIKKDIERG